MGKTSENGSIPGTDVAGNAVGAFGNSSERPPAGGSVKAGLNKMASQTRARIREIARNSSSPVSQVIAARMLIRAASNRVNKSGTPIAGPEIDRIFDRTVGRPGQSIEVTSDVRAHNTIRMLESHQQSLIGHLLDDDTEGIEAVFGGKPAKLPHL